MKLIEALEILQRRASDGGPFHLLLACGFTPLHLATFLKAHLKLAGRDVELRTGLYGDLAGTLRQAQTDALAVVVEWPDLDPRLGIRQLGGWEPEKLPEMAEEARRRLQQLGELIVAAAQRAPVVVSLPTLELPPASLNAPGQLSPWQSELNEALAQWAAKLAGVAGISLINPQELDRLSPPAARHDVKAELESGFPYQLAHAGALAQLLAGLLAPPAPRKGLITDLDDTLWRGILGEVGVEGMAWDIGHGAQAHGFYQQMLRALAQAGVLTGVATKNDPGLVEKALARPDLLVNASDLFPVEAGWGPKSESVRRILEAWNFGAAGAVFIDDSPMELEEVRRAHPEIECILFPKKDPAAVYRLGFRLRELFAKKEVSQEDRLRSRSLRNAREWRQGASATDLDGFLRDARARLALHWLRPPFEARVLELVNKTNQFNINGRRQMRGTEVLLAEYSDKYGPLGKIGVLAGSLEGEVFRIDTWVLSCRAFSRRIEHHMLKEVFERWAVKEVAVEFQSTERNGPAAEFFSTLLGTAPQGAFRLSRERFFSTCPALYHERAESATA